MRVKNQHLSNGSPSPNSKPSASIVRILNVGTNSFEQVRSVLHSHGHCLGFGRECAGLERGWEYDYGVRKVTGGGQGGLGLGMGF